MTQSVAIVGSGPAGFFAAQAFLSADTPIKVDMYERLPVPFGLVRYGVAPDHQKLKSVTAVFEATAADPDFQYLGNVAVGQDVSFDELTEAYDAVVVATGAISDRKLSIAGEDLPGSVSATEFVSWYNGHPEFRDRKFDLSHPNVVVIGNGNVALDVSRILAKTPEELAASDICKHALDALSNSKVTDIFVVGRRGPLQASFSIRELREFSMLSDVEPVFDPVEIDRAGASPEELKEASRMLGILKGFAHPDAARQAARRIHFRFLLSPAEIQGTHAAETVVFSKCELEGEAFKRRAVPTTSQVSIPAGLVLRSVGYRGTALPGVPFDERSGTVPTLQGRIVDADGLAIPKLYAAGWIRRGPSGIIGTNRECATETAQSALEDLAAAAERCDPELRTGLLLRLRSGSSAKVDIAGWHRIDQMERKAGEACGKPREKLTSVPEMLEAALALEHAL
ncbi:MAG: FAD-dependent oxidoreductase [Sulfitobacter sp.]